MNEHGIQVLENCSPYSPDLNIIEIIWAIMKRRVAKVNPKTKKELQVTVKIVWEELSYETIEKLLDSIPYRLQAVVHGA
jgi:transposase